MTTASTSSSPPSEDALVRVPLGQIHPHPANANVMSPERLEALGRNIEREGRYPPLIVRPHPALRGAWQLLDGHQRLDVLRRLGHEEALCFVWPCDDATALLLLATLNRLEGEDLPLKRAELLAELREFVPDEDLAAFLPEDEAAIRDTLSLLDVDADALLAELARAAEEPAESAPRVCSFALLPEDELIVEQAVAAASLGVVGKKRRGRALAAICRAFMEEQDE